MGRLNVNERQGGRKHISQGEGKIDGHIFGDNLKEFQQEHGENLMFQRVLLKLERQLEDKVLETKVIFTTK
jgi:hypothetical protein